MSRSTGDKLILLVNFVVLALIGWAVVHFAPRDHIPPTPWGQRYGMSSE